VKVSDVTLALFAWTDIPSTQYSRSRSTTVRAIGARDVALWDVAGKVSGLPIHRLLGASRDRAPLTPARPCSPQSRSTRVTLQGQGWTAYKIHPPLIPKSTRGSCTRSTIQVWAPRSILILSSGAKSRLRADGEWRAPDVQRLKGKNLRGFNGDHR
jgi:mandelate racemase/muconate lactonizing enzyme-like protein